MHDGTGPIESADLVAILGYNLVSVFVEELLPDAQVQLNVVGHAPVFIEITRAHVHHNIEVHHKDLV